MEDQKLDPWGKPLNVTSESLENLQKEIIQEGIHKRSYSSAEESESDSEERVIKMFTKKNPKKESFDYIGYSFVITNKLSKMRSELARSEERLRYIQLDYNNTQIKLSEVTNKSRALVMENKKLTLEIKGNDNLIKNQNKKLVICTYLMVMCLGLNSFSIFYYFIY